MWDLFCPDWKKKRRRRAGCIGGRLQGPQPSVDAAPTVLTARIREGGKYLLETRRGFGHFFTHAEWSHAKLCLRPERAIVNFFSKRLGCWGGGLFMDIFAPICVVNVKKYSKEHQRLILLLLLGFYFEVILIFTAVVMLSELVTRAVVYCVTHCCCFGSPPPLLEPLGLPLK